jgi:hypothetical protein
VIRQGMRKKNRISERCGLCLKQLLITYGTLTHLAKRNLQCIGNGRLMVVYISI